VCGPTGREARYAQVEERNKCPQVMRNGPRREGGTERLEKLKTTEMKRERERIISPEVEDMAASLVDPPELARNDCPNLRWRR